MSGQFCASPPFLLCSLSRGNQRFDETSWISHISLHENMKKTCIQKRFVYSIGLSSPQILSIQTMEEGFSSLMKNKRIAGCGMRKCLFGPQSHVPNIYNVPLTQRRRWVRRVQGTTVEASQYVSFRRQSWSSKALGPPSPLCAPFR